VRTDLRGVRTHGIRNLPGYAKQLRLGGVDRRASPVVERETAATAMLDGANGLGQVVSCRALEVAISKARQVGAGAVMVRRSNHHGACGHYALACAEAGLIGLVFSNTPPIMAVPGASGRVLGNGPTAYGVPNPQGDPIVLDIAMSVVAGMKPLVAAQLGEAIPEGWIVDARGRPTTDPSAFASGGALLPGGHKGYGLALLGELLAGALSGAAMASAIGGWVSRPERPTDTGHAFIALSVEAFMDLAEYAERVHRLIGEIHAAPGAAPGKHALVPGELEAAAERRALRDGLDLDGPTWAGLEALASELELGLAAGRGPALMAATSVIDCCVHHQWSSPLELAGYLSPGWREYIGRPGLFPGGRGMAPLLPAPGWRHPEGDWLAEATPPAGGAPASDRRLLESKLAERGVERAVLFPGPGLLAGALPHTGYSLELVRALNDWTLERWLSGEGALYGLVSVASQLPEESVDPAGVASRAWSGSCSRATVSAGRSATRPTTPSTPRRPKPACPSCSTQEPRRLPTPPPIPRPVASRPRSRSGTCSARSR
jgi:LDH2 family malate/lactate/ureidoglycolate dehydrogenase